MFLLMGVTDKIKERGYAKDCRCPACGRTVDLHIVNQYLTPHIFFIPTVRLRSTYFATCAACASVMELDPQRGKEFERNPETAIAPDDLRVVQNNNAPTCRGCGSRVGRDQNFCPNCGARL